MVDVQTLPTGQCVHPAAGKARLESKEVDEEIATEGAAEPDEPTGHILPWRSETGMRQRLDLRGVPVHAFTAIVTLLCFRQASCPSTSNTTKLRTLVTLETGSVERWIFDLVWESDSIARCDRLWDARVPRRNLLAPLPTPDPTAANTETGGS